jgi:hypothetical protein
MKINEYTSPVKLIALICVCLLIPGDPHMFALSGAQAPQPPAQDQQERVTRTPDELDSLVAPIALYSDPLLAQVLAASTYPLEVVEAKRWLEANASLQGEALITAAQKNDWDPTVQALVAFPDALKRLDENIQWTTDLGNAFLDQQEDVMDAVQRMRLRAQDSGKIATTPEQTVERTVVENKTVIVIQPADPQVIYVPTYNPVVVYGPPVYPYPPIYYPPPPPPGVVIASAFIMFGTAVALGYYWSGCCRGYGWGWGCTWGGRGHTTIIVNNNFNNHYHYKSSYHGNGNNWSHNAQHRGAVPYSNRNTAQKYGGMARDSQGQMQKYDRPGGKPTPYNANKPQNVNTRDINKPQGKPQTGNRDITKPENRPQTKPATPDVNKPQNRPQTKPATPDINKPQSRPATPDVNRPQTRPATPDVNAPQARPQPRPQPQPQPQAKPQQQPKPQPQAKPQAKPQSKPAPKPNNGGNGDKSDK